MGLTNNPRIVSSNLCSVPHEHSSGKAFTAVHGVQFGSESGVIVRTLGRLPKVVTQQDVAVPQVKASGLQGGMCPSWSLSLGRF